MQYNFDTNTWEEGYYRSFGKYLLACAKDLKHLKFNFVGKFKLLSEEQRQNVIRALVEFAHFMCALVAVGLYNKWDDDEDKGWFMRTVEVSTRRYFTELAALMPTQYLFDEALRILESPSACVNTVENLSHMIKILNPFNYEAIGGDDALIKSGRFKGHDKAYKYFIKSPITGPINTLYRALNPEEAIQFYKK